MKKFTTYIYISYIVLFFILLLVRYLLPDSYQYYIFLLLPSLYGFFTLVLTFKFKLNIVYKIIFLLLFCVYLFLTYIAYIGYLNFLYVYLILPALIIGIGNIHSDYLVLIKNNFILFFLAIGIFIGVGFIISFAFFGREIGIILFNGIIILIFTIFIVRLPFISNFKNELSKGNKSTIILGFIFLLLSHSFIIGNSKFPCSKIKSIDTCGKHEHCTVHMWSGHIGGGYYVHTPECVPKND